MRSIIGCRKTRTRWSLVATLTLAALAAAGCNIIDLFGEGDYDDPLLEALDQQSHHHQQPGPAPSPNAPVPFPAR